MTKPTWWKWATMCLGMIAASFAALAADPKPRADAEAEPVAQGPKANLYRGSTDCKRCHNDGDQSKQELPFQYFIKYNEFEIWSQDDKHSLAYANLEGPRARQMAKLLNIPDLTTLSAGCTGCHGAGEAELKNRLNANSFKARQEGVSCENCHGPSSTWYLTHAELSYRDKSTADREAEGMIDLRIPAVQSAQCLTCHIGNVEQGKVVTHEMYAAGHPPLPSIEVATFSDVIPKHWLLPGEKKSATLRKASGFVEGTKEKTRLSLVGAAVALKTSMKLLADETKVKGDSSVPGLAWADYARFDCWSCHHDLKRESWRQERGYHAAPGRPPISEWPLAIVELGIARLALDDPSTKALIGELAEHRDAVLKEAYARPYGRKVPLGVEAEKFATWCDVLIKRLSTASYTDETAVKLLRILVEKADEKVVDYDAARQIGWTIQILVDDSGDKLTNRSAINKILKKIRTGLKLDLPAGRKYEIEDQLSQSLQIIGDYEPKTFKAHLQELLALLPKG